MARPKIAIVNSSSGLSSCYSHLDDLAVVVKEAVADAGGLAFEIRTAAPSDFVTSAGRSGRYLMPSRDLVVNDVEVQVEGAVLDGMVCLASCDKTTPAQLMAAARLDIPTIIVIGGFQSAGSLDGERVDIDTVYECIGRYSRGDVSLDQLTAFTEHAITSPGVCAGLGTANSMHIMAEALGMTMPGSAPVRATSETMNHLARQAGERIVAMIGEELRPRAILTPGAFLNAVRVALAIGASVNVVRHLAAVAVEAGLDLDVVRLIEEAQDTPLLCGVKPNGPALVEDLEDAGGCGAVLSRLSDMIDLDQLTVSGLTIGEVLEESERKPGDLLRTVDDPYAPFSGLMILRGTLAPNGAIVKRSAVEGALSTFTGPARVFRTEAEAMDALGSGEIQAGDVVVLRGLGPKGGPGTVFAASFVAAVAGAGMATEIAVVTDGELSGLNRGLTVGQVMPEAAEGGPLAAVRDGDMIEIDLDRRALDLVVPADEVAERLAGEPVLDPAPRGWLQIYRRNVSPIEHGATIVGEPERRQ
ncbi:MAG: dihydroxy-acid dehydratase [Acidimicrobiales bacterium]